MKFDCSVLIMFAHLRFSIFVFEGFGGSAYEIID
jgi:hypothetical protein